MKKVSLRHLSDGINASPFSQHDFMIIHKMLIFGIKIIFQLIKNVFSTSTPMGPLGSFLHNLALILTIRRGNQSYKLLADTC